MRPVHVLGRPHPLSAPNYPGYGLEVRPYKPKSLFTLPTHGDGPLANDLSIEVMPHIPTPFPCGPASCLNSIVQLRGPLRA